MKIFVLVLFIALQTHAFTNGIYNCVDGNNDSICPQKIKFTSVNGTVNLRVVYSGYCNDQGPYRYSCENETTCGDMNVGFTKLSETSYYWVNKGYDIHCRFELSTEK
ncbi:hypothetical protein [Pseudobdellovibrio sp. HCB154]|uniref:hypothetical protein n=1 Tax=Pseudobdellovibrio sp. HCB154 TaxID=3386277 RepID=UPI0039175A2F